MTGFLRFSLFFVGVCLVLASALLAYPGGPAYEQSFTHEATLDELPADAGDVTFYRHLTARQQASVERAIDGETIRVPAYRDLPPKLVYHRNRSEIYRFETSRYFDLDRTAARASVAAFVIGVAAIAAAIRMERSR